MKYTKKFNCLYDLHVFVNFHKEETGLMFSSNWELKAAWIDVDEKVYQELTHADIFD